MNLIILDINVVLIFGCILKKKQTNKENRVVNVLVVNICFLFFDFVYLPASPIFFLLFAMVFAVHRVMHTILTVDVSHSGIISGPFIILSFYWLLNYNELLRTFIFDFFCYLPTISSFALRILFSLGFLS